MFLCIRELAPSRLPPGQLLEQVCELGYER